MNQSITPNTYTRELLNLSNSAEAVIKTRLEKGVINLRAQHDDDACIANLPVCSSVNKYGIYTAYRVTKLQALPDGRILLDAFDGENGAWETFDLSDVTVEETCILADLISNL